ncbi:glycosyltransferase family protein [Photobacterium sanguinicancri]|uniref:hypothetical protein n=1 Tax=Photobacterium sanguinicancri TaxID=875932 RepID=UPI0021C45011|nr:hypothetical protein [Photobacterium sanguinicancri]
MIYFLHPSKDSSIGGIESIIYEMVKYASNSNVDIGVIDYINSPLVKRLLCSKIEFKHVVIKSDLFDSIEFEHDDNDVVVIFNNSVKILPFRVKIDIKVLVWDVYYPYWFSGYNKIFNKCNANRFFSFMIEKDGLLTMDEHLLEYTEEKFNFSIPVIPPPLSQTQFKNGNDFQSRKICYIGRCEKWKNVPLSNFIIDCYSKFGSNFVLDIFTDDMDCMKDDLEDLIGANFPKCTIHFYSGLLGASLFEKVKGYDFGLAMGMSALTLADLEVPILLIDSTYDKKKLSDYKYRWLGESDRKFDVGTSLDRPINSRYVGGSLDLKIEELALSRAEIVEMNSVLLMRFSPGSVFKELLICADSTVLYSRDFAKLYTGLRGAFNYVLLSLKRRFVGSAYHW